MARPVLSETIVANEVGVIGGGLLSGSLKVTDPNCEEIQFALQFAEADILSPALFASWTTQEKKEGAATWGNLNQHRGSAIGAIDNDTAPSLLPIANPFISTNPPERRFFNSELRLEYSLAGRPGGVDVVITARQLGADDGQG